MLFTPCVLLLLVCRSRSLPLCADVMQSELCFYKLCWDDSPIELPQGQQMHVTALVSMLGSQVSGQIAPLLRYCIPTWL